MPSYYSNAEHSFYYIHSINNKNSASHSIVMSYLETVYDPKLTGYSKPSKCASVTLAYFF